MNIPVIAVLILLWAESVVNHRGAWTPFDYLGCVGCLICVIYASVAVWNDAHE